MGLILFHTGPVTLLSGTTVSLWAGIGRVLLVTAYVAMALMAAGAIGLAASTLTQHPVGAIAGLLVVIIGSEIATKYRSCRRSTPTCQLTSGCRGTACSGRRSTGLGWSTDSCRSRCTG